MQTDTTYNYSKRGLTLAGALLFAWCFGAAAQDTAPGRALYETHCGGCHYERVHERIRSNVRDLADLRDTVARWAPQTRRAFTLDEREAIVEYLNQSHYRFGLPPRKKP